jgi:hypothetical protein
VAVVRSVLLPPLRANLVVLLVIVAVLGAAVTVAGSGDRAAPAAPRAERFERVGLVTEARTVVTAWRSGTVGTAAAVDRLDALAARAGDPAAAAALGEASARLAQATDRFQGAAAADAAIRTIVTGEDPLTVTGGPFELPPPPAARTPAAPDPSAAERVAARVGTLDRIPAPAPSVTGRIVWPPGSRPVVPVLPPRPPLEPPASARWPGPSD